MSSLHGTKSRKAVNWAEKVPLGQSRQWVLARGWFMIDTVLAQTRGRAPDSGEPITPARDQNTRGSQA